MHLTLALYFPEKEQMGLYKIWFVATGVEITIFRSLSRKCVAQQLATYRDISTYHEVTTISVAFALEVYDMIKCFDEFRWSRNAIFRLPNPQNENSCIDKAISEQSSEATLTALGEIVVVLWSVFYQEQVIVIRSLSSYPGVDGTEQISAFFVIFSTFCFVLLCCRHCWGPSH